MPYAVALRIGMNAAGAAYTWLCDKVLERITFCSAGKECQRGGVNVTTIL